MELRSKPGAHLRALALAWACVPLAGCVSFTWGRTHRDAPVALERTRELAPGQTGLAECLTAFGAPRWVEEHPVAGGQGAVLVWSWLDERDRGISISVPVSDQNSANFDYRELDARTHGLVLFFDERWVLAEWRTGLLAEVAEDVRPRPALAEEEDG